MKKVVLEKPEVAVVELLNVNTNRYYGVSNKNGLKGSLTRRNFYNGQYSAFCCQSVTKGNAWDGHDSEKLVDVIKNLISSSLFTVYEFETSKELFAWLAE